MVKLSVLAFDFTGIWREQSGTKWDSYLEKVLRGGEQAGGQPHEFPAALLAQPVAVVCQLFHDLAVDFVPQDLLFDKKDENYETKDEKQKKS